MTAPDIGISTQIPKRRAGFHAGVRFVLVLSLAFSAFAIVSIESPLRSLCLAVSAGLLCGLLGWWLRTSGQGQRKSFALCCYDEVIQNNPQPQLLTDTSGQVLSRNNAAEKTLPTKENLADLLGLQMAEPANLINRMIEAADLDEVVTERITTRSSRLDLQVLSLGQGVYLWTVSTTESSTTARSGFNTFPMLTVGNSGTILFMNQSARDLLGERRTSLEDVFVDFIPSEGKVGMVSSKSGPLHCLVSSKDLNLGRKEIYLVPVAQKTEQDNSTDLTNLPVALLKLSGKGDIQFVNPAAKELIGALAESADHLSDLVEGLGRPLDDWLKEAREGRAQNIHEFLRLKLDKKEIFVNVALHRNLHEDVPGLIAILNDATVEKNLETQFAQSQKMQAIGQLAGGVAHDFNNLLTAILGHCDLLLLRHQEADPDFVDLTQIQQNANRAAALVGQLLALSRKQTLQPAVHDPRESLSDLTHLLNRLVGESIHIKIENAFDLNPIHIDRRQLEQVIMNLVVNARDAMPDGGEIEITTQNMHLETALSRDSALMPPGDYCVISVADSGTGIRKEHIRLIFEPFFTTKRQGEGTGLGLSTAYGIVKQSGGFIFADSDLGKGTTFQLVFPKTDLQKKDVTDSVETPILPKSVTDETVVLLVEDERPVRTFASKALKLKGFNVIEAENGEAALDLLDRPDTKVHLVVTDVIMPGLDGPSWVSIARKTHPDLKVIFVSGYAEESIAEKGLRCDQASFLPKPFSLAQLTNAVSTQLDPSADTLVQ